MRRYGEPCKDQEPLLPLEFCSDCIIATRGYDFWEGQACSGFTRRSFSRPEATFVPRLQPLRLPQAARQLPDQSTTLRVDSSSTDDSRLRGALPSPDSCTATKSRCRLCVLVVGL